MRFLIWILSLPAISGSVSAVQATYFLSFLFGGPAFAVASGLLIAGISVAGGLSKLLPKSIAAAGLLVALAGELSSLTLLARQASLLLPVARFGGLAWLIVTAVVLPRKQAVTPRGIGSEHA